MQAAAAASAEHKVAEESPHSRLPVSPKFWTADLTLAVSAAPILVRFSGSILHDYFIPFPFSSNLQHLLSNSHSQSLDELFSCSTEKPEDNFHNLPSTHLPT